MSQPLVYIDVSSVRHDKLDQLKREMDRLAAFVEANVPTIRSYAFYLSDDSSQMTVVAIHPDSASLELHMDTGAAEFRKFADLIELQRIEVYGRVGEAVLERLQSKARMLGGGVVTIHELHAGFAR